MKKLIGILILNAMLFAIRTNAETYYVSPSGSDNNPGTIDQPFASWQKLSSVLKAGDVGYLRGGTYRSPKPIGKGQYPVDFRNLNGTSSAHITVSAYPGEYPVLNLDNIVESVFMIGFYLGNCSYIDFKGLRITGLKQSTNPVQSLDGWRVDLCNQITFTQCEVDHMQGPGWRITQATPTSSVFTFTNCDAHHCGDPLNTGGGDYGNADGFDANGGSVTYIGCRAWWNSDDGFDTFYNDANVTYINCWSFWNGFIPGTFTDPGAQADGMGFKWGSTTSDLRTTHLRTFKNCLAFQNKGWGFDQNVSRCIAWFYNNTSYQNNYQNTSHGNAGGGWAMGYSLNPPVASVLKNNISYNEPKAVSNLDGLSDDHNTWNNLAASNSSFASLDTSGVTRLRQSDGSLPNLQFLRLSSGSNMINAGVSIANLLFAGSAPDLGAFEYGGSTPTNKPPTANAGKSQTIVLPTSLATLDGSTSSDADGVIKSYDWSQVSGPSSAVILTPGLATTNVTTLVQGVYKFELEVKDDKGASGKDTVTITVNKAADANQLPIANAGSDITITLPTDNVTLKGNGSDQDGTVSSYQWDKISGPSCTIESPSNAQTEVTDLTQGIYVLELSIKDDKGASGKDTVKITVNKSTGTNVGSNQSPVANAGSDITITLPTNNVTLKGNGSDGDGAVSSYQWDKVSGPSCTIENPSGVQTKVTNLIQGVYVFELQIKDNKGASGKDTVKVTVKKAADTNEVSNKLPVANAGPDITITMPANNSVTLRGSGSDQDGTISSYHWNEISGPPCTIVNPSQAQTVVTDLTQGVFKFVLEVSDDQNGKGRDTIELTINAADTTADTAASKYIKVNIYGGENPYTNGQWNNWDVTSSFNSSVFYYSDGTTSAVNADLSFNWSILDNGNDYGQAAMAPGIVLRYAGYTRTTRTLTIHGLSSVGKYKLELLASQNQYSDNITVFQVGQLSDSIFTYNNYTTKAILSDLSPDSQGQLTITISTPNGYNYLNGFVLTENINDGPAANKPAQKKTEAENNIEPNTQPTSLSIYPNPVSDKFSLDMNNAYTGKMKVDIINQAGAQVGSFMFNKDQQRIHVDVPAKDLITGIYFVHITIGNWSDVRKIIKL